MWKSARFDVTVNSWDKILQHMERRVNAHSFSTWFRPTRLEASENERLLIRVPTAIFRKRLTQTYGDLLEAVLAELGLSGTQLEFICAESESMQGTAAGAGAAAAPPAQAKLDFDSSNHQLNPRYTFETFVVGSSNQFAHAAAQAVAEQPSKSYNPLFLYGGVGLGKTHLMHAIGHAIKRRNPASRLTYVSAEKFTNEVIAAVRFDRMSAFRDRFRTMDILLVDDIQFIAGKERTHEEFFHTFNALYEQQKQIVISSDCPPKEISAIEERLRSRFEWGLIADIQPPDLETKIAILQKKADSEQVKLADDVAEFIARSIKSNIRELEGALIRLLAYASLTGIELNVGTAQQVLKNLIDTQEKKVSIEQIQRRVGEHFGLRGQDLKVRSNSKAIAFPRQVAMYLVKQLTSASLPEIGRQFGDKHHTTVLHSIHKIENLRHTDKELNKTINKLLDSLG
ncbi:MAG TPA: chromosomal replication initiator protein DnaA [Candidatus Acidoferrales bacterium]|nr:chromosomal replication initiator protein DnaA [Candidatus Acidoferrales bacterium]